MNYAVNLAQQIIDGKTPTHAQLGVSLSTVNAQNAKRYGLSVDEGAYVAAVSEGSGAAEAGLQEGESSRSSTARTSHPPATSCWTCAPRTRATR